MDITSLIYMEINIICVFVLIVLLKELDLSVDKQLRNIAFIRVVIAVLVMVIIDAMRSTVDGQPGELMRGLSYALNISYFIGLGVVSLFWFIYTEYVISNQARLRPAETWVLVAPLIIVSGLCIGSLYAGFVFTIGPDNAMHRGTLYPVPLAAAIGYVALGACHLLVLLTSRLPRLTRLEYGRLLAFLIMPTIGAVVSALIPGIPALWPTVVMSLLLTFINHQDHQISTDGLTGLNTRRKFDSYLDGLLSETHRGEPFTIFMMDIDDFKRINDTYGHLAGDAALVSVAVQLQKVCRGLPAFLARYGGDEFVIISAMPEPQHIKERTAEVLTKFNRDSGHPYQLSLSIGYHSYDPQHPETAEEIIKQADARLYDEKRRHRLGSHPQDDR